jgi:hypothetical protein
LLLQLAHALSISIQVRFESTCLGKCRSQDNLHSTIELDQGTVHEVRSVKVPGLQSDSTIQVRCRLRRTTYEFTRMHSLGGQFSLFAIPSEGARGLGAMKHTDLDIFPQAP